MANVGYATLQIIPVAKGFQAALQGETAAPMAASGKKGGASFGAGMLASVKGFAGPIAAVFAGAKILDFFKGAVESASNLNETLSKNRQIFGSAAAAVQQFANNANRGLGQTRQQALDAAATFGVFGKSAGLTGKSLSGFSTQMVQLATDLASFHNTSPQEAIDALGAALRGESEPIRRYGVLLNDASLKQEALRMGLIKTTSQALTPQQRVLAAHALILKQTKDAQGDFARTSGGLANQQRILSAQWADMKAKLGSALLPVVTKAVSVFNSWMPKISAVATTVGRVLGPAVTTVGRTLKTFFSSFTGGSAATGTLASSVSKLGGAFRTLGGFVSGTLLPALRSLASHVGATLGPVFRTLGSLFSTYVVPILSTFVAFLVGKLFPAIGRIVIAVSGRLKPVFDALVSAFQTYVAPALQAVLAKFRQWQPAIQAAISVVVKIVGWILKLAASILGKVLPPIIKLAAFMLGAFVRGMVAGVSAVVKIIGAVIRFGAKIVGAVGSVARFVSGLKSKFGDAVHFVAGIPGKIVRALGHLGSLLVSAGRDVINGLIHGIEGAAGALYDKARRIAHTISSTIKGALGIHSPSRVMMSHGRFIAEGLALGMEKGTARVNKAALAMTAFPKDAGVNATGGARTSTAGPLIGSLTLQSSGDVRRDLEETTFQLRRIARGGVYA